MDSGFVSDDANQDTFNATAEMTTDMQLQRDLNTITDLATDESILITV